LKLTDAFIKQQTNVAHGHQQVNNGINQSSPENFSKQPNELLESQDGKWLDRGKKAKAKSVNSKLEAMAEVHRGKNPEGKAKSKMNAYKHGSSETRKLFREFNRLLREEQKLIN